MELNVTSADSTQTGYASVEIDNATAQSSLNNFIISPSVSIPRNIATLIYTPGITATVTCEITGCNRTYSATLVIPGYVYTTSYAPASRSILLTKNPNIPSSGSVQSYQVQLFNDAGYIKTAAFTSGQSSVAIPLNSLPNGNYYINVIDAEGNVVERKLIPAY